MSTEHNTFQGVEKCFTKCLSPEPVRLKVIKSIKKGKEREVWDCTVEIKGIDSKAIIFIFKPGSLESVNTSLLPDQAVQKCALAMDELPALGIPTPRVLGMTLGRKAAVVCERIERTDWTPNVRIEASRILARIHTMNRDSLSKELQKLVRLSDPLEYRTTGGQAPKPEVKTLVHGDFFSANIIPVAGGLCVIDWETFGWGDPMWDLGFLIGADRNLPQDEVEAVIAEYEKNASVNREHLMWHKRHWFDFWKKRERQLSNNPDASNVMLIK